MQDEAGLALALDDARTRLSAVLALIHTADQQAITLLGIYLTLGTATGTGAAAALVAGPTYTIVSCSLVAATASLFVGSLFCFFTMRRAIIANPGRDPDFWLWAVENDGVTLAAAITQHLRDMDGDLQFNRAVNARSAWYLGIAKLFGVATPLIAGLVGAFVWASGFSVSFS